MTLREFKNLHEAPIEISEFAQLATTVVDCDQIRNAGIIFIKAQADFLEMLEDYDVEIG